MRKNATKLAAAVLSLAMVMTSVSMPASAAKKKTTKINKSTATLYTNGSKSQKSTTLYVTVGGKKVKATFKSSNTKILTVAKKTGKVTAKKPGKATVTATYKKKNYKCTVTVKAYATSVKVSPTSVNLVKGKTKVIKATVSPSNASNKKVSFKSSNKAVATVSSTGKITAKKAGTAKITVTALGSKKAAKKAYVTVKVTNPAPAATETPVVTETPAATETPVATVTPSAVATEGTITINTATSAAIKVTSGSEIVAEGRTTATGTSFTTKKLPNGSYIVTVSKDGYESVSKNIVVNGDVTETITLEGKLVLKVNSVSAITAKTITVNFNRAVRAGENMNQIVVVAPNGIEIVANAVVAEGATSATYTFTNELNQVGTYTVKDTTAKADYTTAITSVDTKLNSDNSVVVTGLTLLADAVQVSVDGTNFVNANLAADGSFAYTTPILSSGAQTITVKAVKGSTVVTKTVSVNIPKEEQAAVSSAEAINPFEIKVVFNQKVEKSSAENKNNYAYKYDGKYDDAGTGTDKSAYIAKATQVDDKTVILTTNEEIVDGKPYQIEKVANVLTASNNQKMTEYKGEVKLFANTNGPKLLKIEKTPDNKFVLTFDKHVLNTTSVKIDGVDLSTASVTVKETNPGDYKLTTATINPAKPEEQALVSNGAHTVVVTNAKDNATSAKVTPVQQMAFTITADTTAPSVKSVKADGYNAFLVEFSEPIYDASGSEAVNLNSMVEDGKLEVKKGNFVYPKQVAAATETAGYVSTSKAYGTTYRIELNDNVKTTVNGKDVYYPLYDADATTTQLSFSIKGYKDAVGLIGNVYSSTVTLSKENVKPYVKSVNLNTYYVDASSNKFMKIKFSESLKSGASDIDATKVSVYDSNNVKLKLADSTPVTVVNGDTVSVELDSASAPTNPAQLFKVVFDNGAVKDLCGNTNDAITTYVDNRAAATKLVITEADSSGAAASISAKQVGVANGDKNVITVNYDEKMGDSAILAANYKLDGASLPVGTKVDFVDADRKTVKITLPESLYSVASKATLTISTAVKTDDNTQFVSDANGNDVQATVALSDNIKPVLKDAKFVASSTDTTTKTIELTFSEGLAEITADTAGNRDDFVVIIGGAEYAVTSIGKGINVAGAGAGNTTAGDLKVRISVADAININQEVSIKVVPVGGANTKMDTVDTATKADGSTAAGNALTAGTVVKVNGTVEP